MKTRIRKVLVGAALLLLASNNLMAAGACTAARFHDWKDCGCDPKYPGAGGAPSLKNCSDCKDSGMPRWWVNEPYINLHISDTPLTYATSSGQEMPFQFNYRQRAKLPDDDEIWYYNYYLNGSLQYTRADAYSLPLSAGGTLLPNTPAGTNAVWINNWNVSIQIWDPAWETNWTVIGTENYPPALGAYPVYSRGFQALVYRSDGGMDYYNVQPNTLATRDLRSLVILTNNNAAASPAVEIETQIGNGSPTLTNIPSSDANGICWGDANMGVSLVYPDGSRDVFSLSANIVKAVPLSPATTPSFGTSTERLFLTQRIDPQGRVTKLGYQYDTNIAELGIYFYRLRYVVDPDYRTNIFSYSSGLQLTNISDPYGRQAVLNYNNSGMLTSIVDAAGMTNSFQYRAPTIITNWGINPVTGKQYIKGYTSLYDGWITQLATPYGNTDFCYYQATDSTVTDGYQARALYIGEPQNAQQLYCYIHNSSVANTDIAPAVPGEIFDTGGVGSQHPGLNYRNTFHWGRRQFAALAAGNSTAIGWLDTAMSLENSDPISSGSSFGSALASLGASDYNKARMRHWLLDSGDDVSVTESLSSERDPSQDTAGTVLGLRAWYSYPAQNTNEPELSGNNPQIGCVAKTLPDGTAQYTTYSFYPTNGFPYPPAGAGMVSNTASSYSLPGGGQGVFQTWYNYANVVDLIGISNSAGQYVNYGYNSSHQITAITNALKQVTTLSWDNYYPFNLTGVQFASGQSVNINYFPFASPATSTSALVQSVVLQPEGRCFTNNSFYAGLPTSVTDDRGVTTQNTWDSLNRLTSTSFPDGTSISNIYYRLDLVAAKDRLTNWTYYAYDGLEHLTSVTNANKAAETYSWCGCDSLDQIIDAANGTNSLNYDNQGNLIHVIFPDARSLTYQVDLAGRTTNVFDGGGRNLSLAYNIQGLVTTVTSANGVLHSAIFDALNRAVSVTDANGVTVTNTFDALNELTKRTWPDQVSEGFAYSTNGLVALTNRDGKVTSCVRDGAGRILSVLNANQETTRFAYDSLDDATDLWDGNGNHSQWQYNEYGWLTNKLDGLHRNALRFAYNANGWVTNRWTPEKGNTGYSYDGVGNLKAINYPQQGIAFAYDGLSRLTNLMDALGSHTFTWTPGSQLMSESDAWTTVNFTNVQGLRTAMSIGQNGSDWVQTYSYDLAWRMFNTVSPAGAFNYQFLTPNSVLPTSVTLPNGATILNGYDPLARMTNTALNNYWHHTLDGYTLQHDPLGLTTNIVRNLGLMTNSVALAFDNIGQITGWTAKEQNGTSRLNEQLSFVYDAAHNLRTRTQGNLTQTFTPNAANEITSAGRTGTYTLTGATPAPATGVTVNGQAAQRYSDLSFAAPNITLANGSNTFTVCATNVYGVVATNVMAVNLPASVTLNFDNNSSLTNDGALLYGYDGENQLTNITLTGAWKSDFVYDGLNRRRIERDYVWNGSGWAKTNETHFIYDGYLIVQERDSNNIPKVTYTRGLDFSGSLQGAGGVCGLLARSDAGGTVFYHSDAVGDITALMDGSENIVGRYLYGPGGNIIAMSGPMAFANVMRSFSEPVHPLSGLLHLPFRDLNLRTSMFLTVDPRGESGGIPLHGFADNNSLRYVDPWGWQAEEREVKPGEQAPETRSPLENLLPNGQRKPESFEDRLQDQMDLQAGARAMRERGLDPNQEYIGPRDAEPKPGASENQKPPCPPKGGVYALRDPASGNTMRTGRSKDLEQREGQHERDPRFKDFDFVPLYRTDDYSEQRGLEHMADAQATANQGFRPPFNYINPISPGNPNFMNYLTSAQQYMNNVK